jgi:uncharacterized membrane protein
MDDNIDIKVSLDEAKACHLRQSRQIEITRDIAKTILGSVTIFVSVVGSLTSIRGTSPSNTSFYNWVVGIAAFLFVVMIVFCMRLLLPEKFIGPVDSQAKVYEEAFFDKDERTVLLKMFSGYLNAVQLNDPIIAKRNRDTVLMGGLMIGIVVCMILLILIK